MKDEDIEKAIDDMLNEVEFMDPKSQEYKNFIAFIDKYGHPPPTAKRVHLASPETALRPRGSMQKESLSALIFERLQSTFQQYTDPSYSDSAEPDEMIGILERNLDEEVKAAWDAFLEWAKE